MKELGHDLLTPRDSSQIILESARNHESSGSSPYNPPPRSKNASGITVIH